MSVSPPVFSGHAGKMFAQCAVHVLVRTNNVRHNFGCFGLLARKFSITVMIACVDSYLYGSQNLLWWMLYYPSSLHFSFAHYPSSLLCSLLVCPSSLLCSFVHCPSSPHCKISFTVMTACVEAETSCGGFKSKKKTLCAYRDVCLWVMPLASLTLSGWQ